MFLKAPQYIRHYCYDTVNASIMKLNYLSTALFVKLYRLVDFLSTKLLNMNQLAAVTLNQALKDALCLLSGNPLFLCLCKII